MADIVIHFTIDGGGDAVPVKDEAAQNNKKKKEDAKNAFTLDEARSVAHKIGSTVANNMIGTMGSRTGNYVMQEQMQTAVSFASSAVSVVTSFVANPYLGIVNLAVQGIGAGFNLASYNRTKRWEERAAHELQRRAGYNSNYNR